MSDDLSRRLLAGAAAGFAATGPMTAVMDAVHRVLPGEEQHRPPPRHITERAAESVGADDDLTESQKERLAILAHFGYGTAAGAVYGLLRELVPLPPVASGVAYGLAVWAGSYMGLLPALRLYPHAAEESAERNLMIVAAHVAWGAVLGGVAEQTAGRGEQP